MKERPILFSGEMVKAILAGRKTQTRRIMKPQPSHDQVHDWRGKRTYESEHRMWCWKDIVLENIWDFPDGDDRRTLAANCPHGKPGDRLWVRETFSRCGCNRCRDAWPKRPEPNAATMQPHPVTYRAGYGGPSGILFRPSIFMPRWASRITLEITEVRVQRLQEISEADALGEQGCLFTGGCCKRCNGAGRNHTWPDGCPSCKGTRHDHIGRFQELWSTINGPGSWDANPWVWSLTFKVGPVEGDK